MPSLTPSSSRSAFHRARALALGCALAACPVGLRAGWPGLSIPALSLPSQLTTVPDMQINGLHYSGLPFAGYDDKSGWLYGGAAFMYRDADPALNAGIFGVTNGNDFHSATFNYEQRTPSGVIYAFHGLAERAFDIYYGEGDLTSDNNAWRISQLHFEARPALLYSLRPHLFVGAFDDYRDRVETSVERVDRPQPGDPQRLFPDESTNALGMRMVWDTRDSILSSHSGAYAQVDALYQPPAWTTLAGASGFSQLKADLRRFLRLRPDLVLASRAQGGYSWGDPGYLFRFRLGGLDALRGYKDDRFRGKMFVVGQEELRWKLNKWFSLNLGADLGDITDDRFHQLKVSSAAGLRVGLPPDAAQKLRVDLDYGLDQQTFQVQFGEVF